MSEMVKISCNICGRNDLPLYRQNKKGERGIFHCGEHNIKPVDPKVEEITSIIGSYGKTKH